MQNKAIAQPAWLQLINGATAGALLSLAIDDEELQRYGPDLGAKKDLKREQAI